MRGNASAAAQKEALWYVLIHCSKEIQLLNTAICSAGIVQWAALAVLVVVLARYCCTSQSLSSLHLAVHCVFMKLLAVKLYSTAVLLSDK